MKITWNGLGSFTITGKPVAGEVTFVTNPYHQDVGLRFPKGIQSSLIISSHEGKEASQIDQVDAVLNGPKPFHVKHAGEYEVQGVFVRGVNAPKKDGTPHTIYRISMEGMKLAFLGAIDRSLKSGEVEALGDIDILMVPVGGGDVLTPEQANEVVNQVEPRVVIPTYYQVKGLKTDRSDVEAFIKEMAMPNEEMSSYKISKKQLPLEDMQMVVLTTNG